MVSYVISIGQDFLGEVILTFFPMFVIMAVATDKRVPSGASGVGNRNDGDTLCTGRWIVN